MQLTPREKDVADLLMTGASNKEICRALKIELVTTKLHMRNLCRKLKAKNRTHAAIILLEERLNNEC